MSQHAKPPDELRTVGLVLAGGRSTRMGRDKAHLELGGVTLLARAVETLTRTLELLGQADAQVWVSGMDTPGVRCLPDRVPGRGPLAGIDAAAAKFPGCRLLVLPVDMPHVSPQLLARLAEDSADAAAASFAGFELPLVLRATVPARAAAEALLVAGPDGRAGSVRGLLTRLGARAVSLPEGLEGELANYNTPADWQRA
jgi:molybdopterin-guanine dinucleotide biosynthesis protein A